jgi:hypothetical protein
LVRIRGRCRIGKWHWEKDNSQEIGERRTALGYSDLQAGLPALSHHSQLTIAYIDTPSAPIHEPYGIVAAIQAAIKTGQTSEVESRPHQEQAARTNLERPFLPDRFPTIRPEPTRRAEPVLGTRVGRIAPIEKSHASLAQSRTEIKYASFWGERGCRILT